MYKCEYTQRPGSDVLLHHFLPLLIALRQDLSLTVGLSLCQKAIAFILSQPSLNTGTIGSGDVNSGSNACTVCSTLVL